MKTLVAERLNWSSLKEVKLDRPCGMLFCATPSTCYSQQTHRSNYEVSSLSTERFNYEKAREHLELILKGHKLQFFQDLSILIKKKKKVEKRVRREITVVVRKAKVLNGRLSFSFQNHCFTSGDFKQEENLSTFSDLQ